jgi:hypothetical protein
LAGRQAATKSPAAGGKTSVVETLSGRSSGGVEAVLRWARRMSLAARLAVVLAGALFSVAASTIAVALEMYLSGHDVAILASVIGDR